MKKLLMFIMPLICFVLLMQLIADKELNFSLYDLKYFFEHELKLPQIDTQLYALDSQIKGIQSEFNGMLWQKPENFGDFFKEIGEFVWCFGYIWVRIGNLLVSIISFIFEDITMYLGVPVQIIAYFVRA